MHRWIPLLLVVALSSPAFLHAQTAATPEDPAHNELRALRTQVLDAIKRAMSSAPSPTFIRTRRHMAEPGGVPRSRRTPAFYNRMGKDAFRGYKVDPIPDELTILYGGDTGSPLAARSPRTGCSARSTKFKNRWTATLVKENGRCCSPAITCPITQLDNPLVNTAKRALYGPAASGSSSARVGPARRPQAQETRQV